MFGFTLDCPWVRVTAICLPHFEALGRAWWLNATVTEWGDRPLSGIWAEVQHPEFRARRTHYAAKSAQTEI